MDNFETITREELKNWMEEDKDFVLIDVLSEDSYETRHLPGAEHTSANDADFVEQVNDIVSDKDQPVVVYCASFDCQLSPSAANKLADADYTQVYDFEGGLADWLEAGYELEGTLAEEA